MAHSYLQVDKSLVRLRCFDYGGGEQMFLHHSVCARLFVSGLFMLCVGDIGGQVASPAKPNVSGSPYKVIRSVSGASGHEENGRYIMDDPRSTFTAGKDSKVTVYFEWEGPPGQHHFEGLWKSPEGKIVLISDFRYEAKTSHFNGYWSMLLSEASPSGEWNLEARIDGEAAGMHSFVVTGSPTAAAAANPAPVPLGSAELYKKALDATVAIEKVASDGTLLGRGSGFWVGQSQLLTTFDVIDGASSLRILLKDGSRRTTDQVLAWNRWQDWALVKSDLVTKDWLKRGSKDAPNVGDRCVFLEIGPAGARLADGSIAGKNVFQKAGERLLVASGVTTESFGGPLLDEYGNYVGIMGGTIVPGADPMKTFSLLTEPGATGRMDWQTTGLALPQALLPEFSAVDSPTSLADLARRGEFLAPVTKSNSLQYVTLTSLVTKDPSNTIGPRDFKRVFSRRDNKATVYANWQTYSKEKLTSVLRLFTADNKLLSEARPRELSLGPGKYTASTWDITLGSLPTGIYRVDLLINDKPAWRDFFRIAD
jgi:hypothetical protein